jgi:hypothetical protein
MTLQEMRDEYASKVRAIDALRKNGNPSESDMARARLWFEEASELKADVEKAEQRKSYTDKFMEMSQTIGNPDAGDTMSYTGDQGRTCAPVR